MIGVTSAGTFAEQFIKSLSLAVEQKLILDKSIIQNLGYCWNDILAGRKDKLTLINEDYGEFVDWVGLKYYLFGSYADSDLYVSTWLYNDQDGNIVFEVTELFKWSIKKTYSEQDPEFLQYLEFLKGYQSIIKVIITPGYAKDLLENIQTLYKLFQQNEQKQ